MSIEKNVNLIFNECPSGQHKYRPIIEGSQTVGLKCSKCNKTVKQDMAHSDIIVEEKNIIFPPTFFEEVKNQSTRDFKQVYHRKDPRF